MEALLAAVSSPKLEYLPLLGWVKGACFAFIAGNLAQAGLFAGLTVLAVAACVLVFVRGNVDYFEDVLQSSMAIILMTSCSPRRRRRSSATPSKRPRTAGC